AGLLLLLALSVYWSVDQHRFERLWLSLLPVKRRAYARDSWREVETAVGGYLRSQAVQSLLAALFLAVGTAVIGFDFPLLLAVVGGLAAFVPLFGGLLTAVFALGLGSLESLSLGLGIAIYTLLVFMGLELLVEPRLWPRKRRSFLLTILVMLPLFETFGVWGLVVAPPMAAAVEAVVGQAYQAYIAQRDTAVQLEKLQLRHQQLAQKIAQPENDAAMLELHNLSQRLANLLVDSQQFERKRPA
ncbi:MAG TPA: AI-2E family transporter, partial [Chloroflexota bacterium]|nr:AI-2E family transporter [Chloroflexota bacterium]